VAGLTDLRGGIDGLAALVQTALSSNPFSGELYIFRGRLSDRVKLLWHDTDGMCLFYKRLHRGRFVWTNAGDGVVQLSAAQLSALLEGIDWRRVHRGDSGGERAAIICSSILSCKFNHIDPQRYQHYVLERIAEHPINRIAELLPWNVKGKLDQPAQVAESLAA